MKLLFWDASALAKRYTAEEGREIANYLFENLSNSTMASTPWGYAETYSILLRRLNSGVLDISSFNLAVASLQMEVVESDNFTLLTVDDTAIFRSTVLMHKHNINATDAAILTVVIDVARSEDAPECVLVASDKRLLRAAEAEGLQVLNPETILLSELIDFIN